jgi:hypothetical protein
MVDGRGRRGRVYVKRAVHVYAPANDAKLVSTVSGASKPSLTMQRIQKNFE